MPFFRKTKYKILLFLSLLVVISQTTLAQEADVSRLRISLLTCSPGEELYSTFGHSALRVIDSNAVSDMVYNYGTFDFNDPKFYQKFIRGKLMYYLNVEQYQEFIFEYAVTNRSITEQVIDLTAEERQRIRTALNENLKEENKFYLYDFFLDNCTTRLRDLIEQNKTPAPVFLPVMDTSTTFRNAIHLYLDSNRQVWSKLGIDLLLGAPCDAVMTVRQQAFLPDNLMKMFDAVPNTRIVQQKKMVVELQEGKESDFELSPTLIFSLVLLFYILLAFFASRLTVFKNILAGFDYLLFAATGLLGCLFIFMMVGTDHIMTKQNYNILWAVPFNIIAAFYVQSSRRRAVLYFLCNAILQGLLLLSWSFLPQELNFSLIPVTILLLFRSIAIWRSGNIKMKYKNAERNTVQ